MGKLKSYDHMKGNRWSSKTNHEEFLKLYNQGLNDSEIGKILGLNHATVSQRRYRYNLPKNFKYNGKLKRDKLKELHTKGYNDRQIAEEFGLNSRWVGCVRRELGLKDNSIKDSLKVLSYEEEQILIGTVLGDTHLSKEYNGKKAGTNGMFAHCLQQKEYALWKHEKLKRLCTKPYERSEYHNKAKKEYFSIGVTIKSDILLNSYYPMFYRDKIKFVSEEIMNKIELLGVAVWFMDDGCKGTMGGYYIATNGFSDEDRKLIVRKFKERFDIHCTIHSGKLIYIGKEVGKRFKEMVLPYMHPTMIYKLHD